MVTQYMSAMPVALFLLLISYKEDRKMTLGKKVQAVREFRKMTREVLGMSIGYPPQSAGSNVASIESGRIHPSQQRLRRISHVLAVSPLAFMEVGEHFISDEEFMETAFWLEEDLQVLRNLHHCKVFFHYPCVIVQDLGTPLARYMSAWASQQASFSNGLISYAEYFDWKLNWSPEPKYSKYH